MKIINNQLYLRINELIDCGIPHRTIYNNIKADWLDVIEDDEQGKLLPFGQLKKAWREAADFFYKPSAIKFAQFEKLRQNLYFKNEDLSQIERYEADGKTLPIGVQIDLKKAAALLAYISTTTRADMLGDLALADMNEFWELIYAFIDCENIALPKSQRLRNTVLPQYRQAGVLAILPRRWGNQNATKLCDASKAILMRLVQDPDGRKFSTKEIHRQFLIHARAAELESASITYQTAANYINTIVNITVDGRHGAKKAMLQHEYVINAHSKGAHIQWQIDGTPAILWHVEDGKLNKLYVITIMDTYSQAIVGYAIAESETSDAVATALKMAIRSTGYVPREVRTDKGSAMISADTKQLFSNLQITHVPTATGRARAKSIESAQGNWQQNISTYFLNKSGQNINARKDDSHQNPDALRANLHKYPQRAEVIAQIQLSIELYNQWTIEGKSTRAEMVKNISANARPATDTTLLEFFVWRMRGKALTMIPVTQQGIELTISGNTYRYIPSSLSDNPDELAAWLNTNANITKVYIRYDAADLETIGLYTSALPKPKPDDLRFWDWAIWKPVASASQYDATASEKAALKFGQQVQQAQRAHRVSKTRAAEELLEAQKIIINTELSHVRKDDLNRAKQALQRLEAIGYHNTELSLIENEAQQISQTQADATPRKRMSIFEDFE